MSNGEFETSVSPLSDLQEKAGLKTGYYNGVRNRQRTRYHLGRYDYAEIHAD
jgi:hypothetical protein